MPEKMTPQETIDSIKQGTIGGGATGAGLVASTLEQLEQWLQIASLSVGLVVGLITLYNLTIKKWRNK